MARPNYNQIRFIRRTIRQLKSQYGGQISVYQLSSADTDLDTGNKTATYTSVAVDRAVILPNRLTRASIQTISVISANKRVVQGGTYDPGLRWFIIDRTDVPNVTLGQDDWIVFNRRRYDIKTIDEFEFDAGWLISAKEVRNRNPRQDTPVAPYNHMTLTHVATGVIT